MGENPILPMKTRLIPLFAAAFAVSAAYPSEAARFAVDLRGPAGGAVRSAAPDGEACLRGALLPPGAATVAPLSTGDTVELLLFDGVSFAVTLDERADSPLGGDAFLGEVAGSGGVKTAVVLQTAEGLSVDIQDFARGRAYTVFSDTSGVVVKELAPSRESVDPADAVVPPLAASAQSPPAAAGADIASEQASTLVDVLVAFDTPAAAWARQNGGGTTNFATMAVQKMNTVLANGGLDSAFRYRLVGVAEVAAEGGTDFSGVLSAMHEGTGAWAAVKAKRDEVGADVVSALVDTGSASGTTGRGYSLENTPVSGFSEWAYNVCAVRAVAQDHTMTHEIGHNLGAGHATEVEPSQISPGPQLFDYSAGHYFTGTNGVAYHTIMAYNFDGFGNHYASAPFFSSPDCFFMGTATGDATHDNVRTLRETYAAAAKWRAQVMPMSYDVFFSPEDGTLFTDSLVVALAPGKAGLPIRYTLDGSAPTLSSPLYAGAITLTETTTIRAATVTDGVLGPVFEATYSLSDLGSGLDAPLLAWRTSDTHPWAFETTNTFDRVDAVQSFDDGGYWENESWLETTVEGPVAMGFRYQTRKYIATFSVLLDGESVLEDTEDTAGGEWHLSEIAIPSGAHTVRFLFRCWIETENGLKGGRYDGFNGAWLDTISFDALSRPPVVDPPTTADEATATTFQGSLAVTLAPPDGKSGVLHYTTDGSDPTGETALVCDGPIVLNQSTRLRAVFTEFGKEPSTEVGGLYLERHPVQPGEWTTDVEGVKTAAARDGRLIAVLMADRVGCGWSKAFQPVAESPEFLAWAKANGVYLATADSSCNIDAGAAESWFWQLRADYGDSGSVGMPTLYFASPDAPETAIGTGLARSNGSVVGSVPYGDTAASLAAGFASVLAESVPEAPVFSPADTLVDAFPIAVTIANPNGSGTVFCTLDGSAPTPANGTGCTGAVGIADASLVLSAAVWPDSPTGFSSLVSTGAYRAVADVFGTTGIAWARSGDASWRIESGEPATLRAGGLGNATGKAILSGTVSGKGTLVFDYRCRSYSSRNVFAFAIDGAQRWQHAYDGTITVSGTVTNEVDSDGSTTFTWTLSLDDAGYDFSSAGAWLSAVRWIPEGIGAALAVEGVSVPYAWLDAHFPGQGGTAAAYEALALSDADGDAFPAWQEYLLATDPTDAESCLVATIRMEGGRAVFGWEPTNAALASLGWRYIPQGRETMDPAADWESFEGDRHRFFRIWVERIP